MNFTFILLIAFIIAVLIYIIYDRRTRNQQIQKTARQETFKFLQNLQRQKQPTKVPSKQVKKVVISDSDTEDESEKDYYQTHIKPDKEKMRERNERAKQWYQDHVKNNREKYEEIKAKNRERYHRNRSKKSD